MLECEPGSWNHEPGVSLGDRDGNAGGHDTSLARPELDPFARDEVEAGIAGVRASRNGRIVANERDRQLDHGSATASRTRNGARRRSSRSGSRARMKTPSARSSRSSIGGPRA